MEKIEDIEDFYKKGIEKLDNDFLDKISKIKKDKDGNITREEYKKKLKELRTAYEKRYVLYLKEQKDKIKKDELKKINAKIKTVKINPFKVEKLDFRPTKKDKLKNIRELRKFKSEIYRREFLERNTPELFLRKKMIIGLKIKEFSHIADELLKKIFSFIKRVFLNMVSALKDAFIFVFAKIKSGILFLINYIKKKTKKTGKDENKKELRPDEEIAERLLKKSKDSE